MGMNTEQQGNIDDLIALIEKVEPPHLAIAIVDKVVEMLAREKATINKMLKEHLKKAQQLRSRKEELFGE